MAANSPRASRAAQGTSPSEELHRGAKAWAQTAGYARHTLIILPELKSYPRGRVGGAGLSKLVDGEMERLGEGMVGPSSMRWRGRQRPVRGNATGRFRQAARFGGREL